MASIGVARLVLAKVLNHTDSAVTAIYDRYSYDAEKREALEKWATHLETLGLEAAVAKLEAKVDWQVTGKWWAKRVARLGAATLTHARSEAEASPVAATVTIRRRRA
jgi:hypothetical protein